MFPYLFLLIMEAFFLAYSTRDLRMGASLISYNPNCAELKISHVCFADDLFILANADVSSVNVINRALGAL